MKNFIKIPLLGGLALTFVLAGCGNKTEPASPTAPPMKGDMDNATTSNAATPAAATATSTSGGTALGIAPGTATQAGPFEINLTLDAPEPRVGDAPFKVTVTRDGKPVEDATVKLDMTMPQMKMDGPKTTLAHAAGGVYAGKANLSMGGAYSTKVEVSAGADRGAATYDFRAVQ